MRTITAADVTRLCEWGADKHDLDRAIALLRLASPGESAEALAELPVGQRDARLMKLRSAQFGPQFDMRVECPKCQSPLEFGMNMNQLLQDEAEPNPKPIEFSNGTLVYRLPNSRDMSAIATLKDPAQAQAALFARCIAARDTNGNPMPPSDVPEDALKEVIERWVEEDPQSDVTFKLTCAECRHKWRTIFDILSYFWMELEVFNRRLQDDIHLIASRYGWSEDHILTMTTDRRKRYIELIGE